MTLRMTAFGPSRHFAPPHDFGSKRGIAEVEGQPSSAKGDARDHPEPTFGLVAMLRCRSRLIFDTR